MSVWDSQPQKKKSGPNPLLLIVGVLVILLLIGGGIWAVFGRSDGSDELAQLAAEVTITPTHTATPFPTATPTQTPSPTPLPTATPSPTPLPEPIGIEVEAPEFVPAGLPAQVTWRVVLTGEAASYVAVALDNIIGVMLLENEQGTILVENTLVPPGQGDGDLYPTEWLITGLIDPNVGQGTLDLYVETPGTAEVISMPWVAGDVVGVQSRTYSALIDGESEFPPQEIDAQSLAEAQTYSSQSGLRFSYPAGWLVSEGRDGTLQIVSDPAATGVGVGVSDYSYITITAGEFDSLGLPAEAGADAESVLGWLLGSLTASGADGSALFVSSELAVSNAFEFDFDDGGVGYGVRLVPAAEDAIQFEELLLVRDGPNGRLLIFTAFVPAGKQEMGAFEALARSLSFE